MTDINFQLPPLSSDDQSLVDVYQRIGLSVDSLAYSDKFEELCRELKVGEALEDKQKLYRRLLDLRKRGRLPMRYAAS